MHGNDRHQFQRAITLEGRRGDVLQKRHKHLLVTMFFYPSQLAETLVFIVLTFRIFLDNLDKHFQR